MQFRGGTGITSEGVGGGGGGGVGGGGGGCVHFDQIIVLTLRIRTERPMQTVYTQIRRR